MSYSKRVWWVLLVAYLLLVVTSSYAIWQARRWALSELEGDDSRSAWEAWRQETTRDASQEDLPVQRRPLAHREPPTLAMLRDHFVTSWVGMIALGSIVFWTICWLFLGAFARPAHLLRQNAEVD